ncbi:MAG: hypothetical protein K6B52_02580 [Clostridiales bacterium]|nr:hypothetical protein [Clostridiales bacterium]
MKNSIFKKSLCVMLSFLMILPCLCIAGFAGDAGEKTGKFTLINANVAGLPNFGSLAWNKFELSTNERAKLFGDVFNESGADIIAVQEDFAGSRALFSRMSNYKGRTINSGGVPFGSGVNIFSKNKLYNVKRYPWRTSYGVYREGDQLAPKGIVYAVVEIADGVFVDVYNLHADAFGTQNSQTARIDNFNQLYEVIVENGNNRPIIVTGDFNVYFHSDFYSDPDLSATKIKTNLLKKLGMKEAWVECVNGGKYDDFSEYMASGVDCWGNWDSVEKIFYCDGGGIHLEALSYEFVSFKAPDGNALSDHNAAVSEFTYTVTDDYSDTVSSGLKKEIFNPVKAFFDGIKIIIKDLYLVFTNIDELIGMIKEARA